jgi:hypothetical protein
MTLWTLGTVLWLALPSRVSDQLITRARLSLHLPGRNAPLPTTDHSNATARRLDPPALALRPVYRTTAEQLDRAYDANAVAVRARIGASLVRLTGSVAAIDQDATGHPVVRLWTSSDGTAAMTLDENQRAAAAQLVKGEAVDLECDQIDRSGAVLQGNGCKLEFVDTRTREVNLAVFLAGDSGATQVYVVGPMPEAVCRERSEAISSRLRNRRDEHVVSRDCTDGGRESILPGGCHLNSSSAAVPDLPSAHLWRYDCASSTAVARTSTATRGPPATVAKALPVADTDATAVEPTPSSPAATTNNIRVASAATSDISTTTAAPRASRTPDDLAQVAASDPLAAYHIAAYCSTAAASAHNRVAFTATCRRNEAQAWTRLVTQNEFPTLDEATRKKCSEPPIPDTYVAKEKCARHELQVH